jgi:hypothetical protein
VELVKKDKYLELLLWGIVAYTVAILTYFTLKAFGHGADYISAFGSILSSIATFFAAYIAVALFNDWKEQHNKQVENQLILTLVNDFNKLDSLAARLFFPLLDLHKSDPQEVDCYFKQFRTNLTEIRIAFLDTTISIERIAIFSGNLEDVIEKVEKYNLDFLKIMDDLSNLPLGIEVNLVSAITEKLQLINVLIVDIENEYVKKSISKLKVEYKKSNVKALN